MIREVIFEPSLIALLLLSLTPSFVWISYDVSFLDSLYVKGVGPSARLVHFENATARGVNFWEGWLTHVVSLALALRLGAIWWRCRRGRDVSDDLVSIVNWTAAAWVLLLLALVVFVVCGIERNTYRSWRECWQIERIILLVAVATIVALLGLTVPSRLIHGLCTFFVLLSLIAMIGLRTGNAVIVVRADDVPP